MEGLEKTALVFVLSLLATAVAFADENEAYTVPETAETYNELLGKIGAGNDRLFAEILQRLNAQEARIMTLEATVHRQQEQHANVVNQLKTELTTQADQLRDKVNDIRKLKLVQRQQRKLIDDLKAKLQYNIATENKYKQSGAEKKDSVTKRAEETGLAKDIHENQIENSMTKNENRRMSQYRRAILDVAFHVIINTKSVDGLGTGQKIVFDTVLLNIGSSYHQHLGVFIAPTRGVYFFSVSLLSLYENNTQFEASISKNGIKTVSVFGKGTEGSYDQGSSSATIELNQGDEVWIQFDWPTGGGIWGNKYSSFTGYLLFPN